MKLLYTDNKFIRTCGSEWGTKGIHEPYLTTDCLSTRWLTVTDRVARSRLHCCMRTVATARHGAGRRARLRVTWRGPVLRGLGQGASTTGEVRRATWRWVASGTGGNHNRRWCFFFFSEKKKRISHESNPSRWAGACVWSLAWVGGGRAGRNRRVWGLASNFHC